VHPTSGKEIYFESAIPEDMQTVLDKWRRYVSGRENQEVPEE
jgi:23S rRNA pseudouridine1911/1915/1917 synthase